VVTEWCRQELNALDFSPCGQRFATGGNDGVVILWDAQTGRAEQRMQADPKNIWSLSFAADGARLACGCSRSGSRDGSICVLDATTRALLRSWEEEIQMPEVQFSPVNNSIVATVSFDDITFRDVDKAARC